jgi:hypothetical protein
MLTFVFKIFLAHLMGDFLFQTSKMAQDKEEKQQKSVYLYLHLAIHALALLVLLQLNYALGIGIIVISHFVIDLAKLKLRNRKNDRILFFADQLAHLAVLAGVVYLYYPFTLELELLLSQQVLIFFISLLFVTVVSSIIMKVLISRWDLSSINDVNSLEKAGTYIGMLERLFIFGFIVIDYWAGIGFLLTAKSVFRFGDLSKANDRKLTEYILIGTLLSFGMAILSGMGYRYLINFIGNP